MPGLGGPSGTRDAGAGRARGGASASTAAALARLEQWIEAQDFRGWDPYDALNSPVLRALTAGRRRVGMAFVQLFKRSPVNLRPLFGVPRSHNPKGMGLFLASYLRKWWTEGDEGARQRSAFFADWLREHASPGYAGACWGYDFPWPNRSFFAPAGTPTVVTTAFNALALLDSGDVATARSACDFVLRDLERDRSDEGLLAFSYTPLDRSFIHNASLLGAELLAAVYGVTGEPELAEPARAAARLVAREQRPDGSWSYGADAKYGWVDNFHTGYVLCSLRRIGERLGTEEFDAAIDAGYAFWRDRMFREDGAPKYYADRVHPIDAHAVSQAILTYLDFETRDPSAGDRARSAATWGIENMQEPEGWFDYQIHARYRIRIPYMRWTQAWMQRALRELAWAEAGRPRAGASSHAEGGVGQGMPEAVAGNSDATPVGGDASRGESESALSPGAEAGR